MPNSTLYDKFMFDKKATLCTALEFLRSAPKSQEVAEEKLLIYRLNAVTLVSEGNISLALQALERLRDAKTGIVIHVVHKNCVPIIIRDARNVTTPPIRETEAFEMQYLNVIRAGMDVAEIADKTDLNTVLNEQANKFMEEFSDYQCESQEALSTLLKKELKTIVKEFEENGILSAYEKLNVAKDFQNLNDENFNIVTISSIEFGGKLHIVIEAKVAMRGLTETQKTEYENILKVQGQKPAWYTAMPQWEQRLCKKYASNIASGEHVIPTQLRQITGMKNAFEKITAIYNDDSLEILHTSKHAGTLASLARDESVRQKITDDNARQAQEWIGTGKILHCNTFNSGPFGAGDDPEIVRRTNLAMKNIGGKHTNTAFNGFRYSGFANDLSGAKDTLTMLAECLSQDKDFEKMKSFLKPKVNFKRFFQADDAEKVIQRLAVNEKIDIQTAEILEIAVDLRRSVEHADSILRLGDAENASLATSTKLNKLTKILSDLEFQREGMIKFPLKEEILNMCASGKDRTGLAEHDQSAHAIASRIGANVNDIDSQLLACGHTAQVAGGVYSGGGTIGCFGTKNENRAGLPASRKKGLEAIVEVSANSNKIKGKKRSGPFYSLTLDR